MLNFVYCLVWKGLWHFTLFMFVLQLHSPELIIILKKNINPGRSDIMFILDHRFMAILIQFASADFYFSNHNFLTTCFFMTFDQ